MSNGRSLPLQPLSKEDVHTKLAAGWARIISKVGGRGTFADKCGCCTDTIKNALAGPGLPEGHTIFNSLRADVTALDEILREYGVRAALLQAEAANDLSVAAGASEISGAICRALADGVRKHPETLEIADLIRPHLPALTAIVREADQLRGAA